MPRRSGRPGSAASLHISKPDMSVNIEPDGNPSNEVRVVVQQLPAVELAEEGSERLVQHCPGEQLSHTNKEGVEEVRTRLRPHRSSWKDRFPADEKKPIKSPPPVTAENQPKSKPKAISYPSEDMACIEKNLHLPLQHNTSPEKPTPSKAVKGRGRPSATEKLLNNSRKPEKRSRAPSTEVPVKVQKKPEVKVTKTAQNSGEKSELKLKIEEAEKKKVPEKQTTVVISSTPVVDDSQWHNQNKQKTTPVATVEEITSKQTIQIVEEREMTPEEIRRAEAVHIAQTVQDDALIQKFGVRLLGMSLDPEQKILAVSQRMIELVRLLRASQGLESKVESLTHLLQYDHWPLITQAILYVSGYDQETNSFRNPAYVFDIGQAMKFCAHILKNEAAVGMDTDYEWQVKAFMNSIDSKIDEILPNAFQFRNFGDGTTVQNVDTCESQEINELITTLNGDSGQGSSALAEMLPQVMDVMSTKPEEEEGERQASLLLELSRGFSYLPEPELQNCQPEATPVVTSVTQIKPEPQPPTATVVSTSEPKKPSPAKLRILKIVSPTGQPSNRKYCLIIPSEVVQNNKVVKTVTSNSLTRSVLISNTTTTPPAQQQQQVLEQGEMIISTCGNIELQPQMVTSCASVSNATTLLDSDIALLASNEDIATDINSQASDVVSVSATLLENPPTINQIDAISEAEQQRHTLASLCGVNLESEQQ